MPKTGDLVFGQASKVVAIPLIATAGGVEGIYRSIPIDGCWPRIVDGPPVDAAIMPASTNSGAAMADRTKSPAYATLPGRSARRMLATIEKLAADNDGVATISYTDLRLPPHGFGRPSISMSLKVLIATGLIDALAPGPRMVGRYRLSDRWRTISEADAKRLAREARAPMQQRRHEKRRVPVEPQPVPETHDEPVVQFMVERKPSMPSLVWLGR